MSDSLLKIKGVSKKLSENFSLTNIDLDLNEGEVHAIVGENGSGKSSIMNILSGLYIKDSGHIYIEDELVNIASPLDAKKLGITMIHQESSLFEHISIAENIFIDTNPYLSKKLKLIDFKKMHNECEKLLNKFGLNISSKTIVKHLSPAQKQIIEIAKAYVSHARIIIMDEPTSSLGENETSILLDIIKELKNHNISIFYITHKLEEINKICDRVSTMRDGKIIGTRSIENISINDIFNMIIGFDSNERYPKINFKLGNEVLRISDLNSGDFLKHINLSLRKKEILGITGLIGCGGTKIAESIFGINKIDSGKIIINGNHKQINSPSDAIKAGIAYVTEDRIINGLFPHLKVYENISAASMYRIKHGFLINEKYEKEMAISYMDKLGIKSHNINSDISHLSGGSQQKVVLAKWIMSKSKIFIFDEPTKGIDIASKIDVYNLMNELLQKGAAIILISSDLHELMGMCDRIAVLSKGRIIDTIPRQRFSTDKILELETK